MLKKTISYQNLDGVTVTEDFWFQISKGEVAEMALIEGDDFGQRLTQLSQEKDGAKIIAAFKKILSGAVGRREGQLFIKNDDIRSQFMYSGAYDAFFFEMLESPDSGASIIRAMLPSDAHEAIDKELAKRAAENGTTTVELPASAPVLEGEVEGIAKGEPNPATPTEMGWDGEPPAWFVEKRNPSPKEMQDMSREEMVKVFQAREQGLIS